MSQDHTRLPPTRGEGQGQDAYAEVQALRAALEPFAAFGRILIQMGGNTPWTGDFYRLETVNGEAAITVEDFKAAIAAMPQPHPPGGNSHEG